MAHALLSPSSASRWLTCTRSARLEQDFPDRAGRAAAEGTLAHSFCDLYMQYYLQRINRNDLNLASQQLIAEDAKKAGEKNEEPLYHADMESYADDYAVFIMEKLAQITAAGGTAPVVNLETKVDMTRWVPEGFGTLDCNIVANRILYVFDYKYGKGVPVSATENKQMMLYSAGTLNMWSVLYDDIEMVEMTIYQPRIDNFSTWSIPAADLLEWANTEVRVKAKLAFDGKGEFVPGKHCQFCRAKPVCKAYGDLQLEIAQHDFEEPALLADEVIVDILRRAKEFESWLKAVKEHALVSAVHDKKKWPGMKLVEGRSNRKISDPAELAAKLIGKGFPESDIYQPLKLEGITALEKLVGKKEFTSLAGSLIIKPSGKPTLVDESDKRAELNSLDKALEDFAGDFDFDE